MIAAAVVHVVVPEGIDDPMRPSGGNVYDRRVCDGLTASGWLVHEIAIAGDWPVPDADACASLADRVAELPDGAVVLLDGLVASAAPDALVPHAERLQLAVLVHMPLGEAPGGVDPVTVRASEQEVLSSAACVLTTSRWTRRWLLDQYALRPGHVAVAEPGVDAADIAPGTASGGELLCVAAVAPHKGHDVLVGALASMSDLTWRCVCVGSLDRDPAHVDQLRKRTLEAGIDQRMTFVGPLTGADLAAAYAAADLVVLASRGEAYGMVVTEALARGLPVVATAVGGVPEAMGGAEDGTVPGILVPLDDPAELARALRRWITEPDLRERLRAAARERRLALPGWQRSVDRLAQVLSGLSES